MVHESCNGCEHIKDGGIGPEENQDLYCIRYADPLAQWKYRKCAGRTHNLSASPKELGKQLNPLKASKRAMGK